MMLKKKLLENGIDENEIAFIMPTVIFKRKNSLQKSEKGKLEF
jgi:hypothetical protein